MNYEHRLIGKACKVCNLPLIQGRDIKRGVHNPRCFLERKKTLKIAKKNIKHFPLWDLTYGMLKTAVGGAILTAEIKGENFVSNKLKKFLSAKKGSEILELKYNLVRESAKYIRPFFNPNFSSTSIFLIMKKVGERAKEHRENRILCEKGLPGKNVNEKDLRLYPLPNETYIQFARDVYKKNLFRFQPNNYTFEGVRFGYPLVYQYRWNSPKTLYYGFYRYLKDLGGKSGLQFCTENNDWASTQVMKRAEWKPKPKEKGNDDDE